MKKLLQLFFTLLLFILCFQNKTNAQCWNNGDLTSYNRIGWDQNPSNLLTNNFLNVYPGFIDVGGNFFMEFNGANAILSYLPSTGIPGPLTSTVLNPTDASCGTFGGDVLALQFNVDFSDAAHLSGNSNIKFGDLVLSGLSGGTYYSGYGSTIGLTADVTQLNGLTVRQILTIMNALLGDGSSGGFTVADIVDFDPIVDEINHAFEGGTPNAFAQHYLKKGWKSGDVKSFPQSDWGADPNSFLGAASLNTNYNNVYGSAGLLEVGIPGNSGYSMLFTSANDVLSYLPQSNTTVGPLTADLLSPTSSPSGAFGGEVVGLRLNVDFSDAGFLVGNSNLHFGDLVLYDMGSLSGLNGMTVRQFLAMLQTLLGGGSATYSISDVWPVGAAINNAFYNGTPTSWAQLHLKRGWQNGDLATYTQSEWGNDASNKIAPALLEGHFDDVYATNFFNLIVGGTFTMTFDGATAIENYLPQPGAVAALDVSLADPTSSASGQFGGDVVTLKLNVDFSDAGLLGSANIPFGNLTLCNMSNIPWINANGVPVLISIPSLNGITVRQFLAELNILLGGGSSSYGTIADLQPIAVLLNLSFDDGYPGNFAQLHLVNGSCDCGNTVTNHCPTAAAINVSTTVGSAVKFILQGSDADNNMLTYSISQSPTHGTAVIAGGDSILYTPAAAYHGTDQLKYTVSDGQCSAEAVVNITVVVCPGGQGYWKNNQSAWPVSSLMLGTNSYSKSQLITILNTAIGNGNNADASLILADQLIGAKLSLLNSSPDPGHVADSIAAADALIGSNLIPMKVKPNSALGKKMTSLANYFSSYNNGALTQGCTQPMITMAETQDEIEQIPGGYRLEQNYPNPFGNGTIIQYELPVNSHVRLEVFNLLGEKVATLVDEHETAGYKTVQFNASNRTNGVYYYRLTADKFSETKKMILVK